MPQVVVVVVTALAAFAAVLLAIMRTVPHADNADDDNEAMTNIYCFDQEDDNYYDHYHVDE